MKKIIPVLLFSIFVPGILFPGTTGKVSGRIVDKESGEAIPFANVLVEELAIGAVSDLEGYYFILNVPPGAYTVQARVVGYAIAKETQVRVTVDQTTQVNFRLGQELIDVPTIDVFGDPIIKKDVTQSQTKLTRETFQSMAGVENFQEALVTGSNVVTDPALGEIHMRGGRGGEILFMVDGLSIKDPLVGGGFGMKLEGNAVEEITIISGGFPAEYGDAQSGIINVVTREGSTKDHSGRLYFKTDDLMESSLNKYSFNNDRAEFSLGGPDPISTNILSTLGIDLPGEASYFVSGVGDWTDTYTPFPGLELPAYEISGIKLKDRQQNDYSTNAKWVYKFSTDKKLTLGFRGSWGRRIPYQHEFLYIPEFAYRVKDESDQESISWNHTLPGGKTFYNVNLGRFLTSRFLSPGFRTPDEINHYTGGSTGTSDNPLDNNVGFRGIDGLNEPFIDLSEYNGIYDFGEPYVDLDENGSWKAGEPFTDLSVPNGHYDPGEPFNDYNKNGQWDGDEPYYDYGVDGYAKTKDFGEGNLRYDLGEPFTDYNQNGVRDEVVADGFYDYGFDQWAQWHKRRTEVWTFKGDVSSQVTNEHFLKSGVEVKYHEVDHREIQYPWYEEDDRGPVPGEYPTRGIFRDFYVRYPTTGALYVWDKIETEGMIINAGFRFDFWHPGQQVEAIRDPRKILWFETLFEGKLSPRLGISHPISDKDLLYFSYGHFSQIPELQYLYSDTTQFGGAIRLYGNPNIASEKTVAYELGVKHAFNNNLALDVTGYFKDVRGLIDTEKRGEPPFTYQIFDNRDYANVRGLDLKVEKRYSHYFSGGISYSLSWTFGKSSSDRQGYDFDNQGKPIPLRDFPLDWDQRHSFTTNFDYRVQKGGHPSLFGLKMPDRWGINLLTQFGSGLPFSGTDSLIGDTPNDRRKPYTMTTDLKANKDFSLGPFVYSIILEVTNLFDKRNVLSVFTDTGTPQGDGRPIENDPENWGPGRNIRVGASVDF